MKKKKFNCLDVLILLLVIAVACAMIFRAELTQLIIGNKTAEFEFTAEFEYSGDGILQDGAEMTFYAKNNALIGDAVLSKSDTGITLYQIKVVCTGYEKSGRLYAEGGQEIAENLEFSGKLDGISVSLLIVEVRG